MKRKESLRSGINLKNFYTQYNEQSEVSVFTMAENATQMKTHIFSGESHLDQTNPVYRKIVDEKQALRLNSPKKGDTRKEEIVHLDTEPIIEKNIKELKTLQFELEMMISDGLKH